MPNERLSSRDIILIAAVVAIAALSVTYTWANYTAAFPQASLNLKLSKGEITRQAAGFLRQRNLSTAGYRNLTLFDPDDDARIYLEREVGLERANQLMENEVSVWRWRARWFRPPAKDELTVYLNPAGKVVGFERVIPELDPGTRLSKEAARAIATSFLNSRTSLPQRLIEDQLIERPNRYDYSFTWERTGFRVKDATYRTTVIVQGDRVGQYAEGLHVPEQWSRDFAALRSRNDLYAGIAQALWVPLVLAALIYLVIALRRRNIPWRQLILLAGTVGGLMVISQWNEMPFFIDRVPTSSTFGNTVAIGIFQALGAGVGVFFYVILAAAAGEPLYRAALPARLSLPGIFTGRGIRTRQFFLGTVVGYGFAAFHIAFVVAFYLVGRRFGVWSPQDVQYSDLLSTWLPWIYPLTIALLAATSEEFWFRLFAIPLLKRWVRFTPIAVVIPAFLWGFLHANYPQQPAYIRGIEVGIIGVAAGFLMLRFGIIATLVWHYTVDAVLIGMFLFQSDSWYFRLSGGAVAGAVLFPLLASLFAYWRNGGFASDSEVVNAGVDAAHRGLAEAEAAEPAAPARVSAPEVPHAWPIKWLYGAALLALLAGAVVYPIRYGSFVRVRVERGQAESVANREMTARRLDPAAWRRVTQFVDNLDEADFEYLRENGGPRFASNIVRDRTATAIWRVRYFHPQRKEEWQVLVDQDGSVYRVDHLLDEKAPGARLSSADALAIAQHYVSTRGLDLSRFRLVDSQQEQRDNRTDYAFTWEDSVFRAGTARARLSLQVQGDEPSEFRRFLKLPEEWLRNFERPRLQGFLLAGLLGAIALPILVVFLRRLGGRAWLAAEPHRFHWRVYLWLTGVALLAAILSAWNGYPLFYAGYDTAMPLDNYRGQALIGQILIIVFTGLAALVGVMALDVFRQLWLDDRPWNRPSLPRTAAVAALLWGAGRALVAAGQYIPGPRLSLPLWQISGAGTALPGLSALTSGVMAALVGVAGIGTIVFAGLRFLHGRTRWLVIAAAAVAFGISRSQTPIQAACFSLQALAAMGIAGLILGACADDLTGFAVAIFWLQAAGRSLTLLEQPAADLHWNGAAALAAATAIALGVIWRYRLRARS